MPRFFNLIMAGLTRPATSFSIAAYRWSKTWMAGTSPAKGIFVGELGERPSSATGQEHAFAETATFSFKVPGT